MLPFIQYMQVVDALKNGSVLTSFLVLHNFCSTNRQDIYFCTTYGHVELWTLFVSLCMPYLCCEHRSQVMHDTFLISSLVYVTCSVKATLDRYKKAHACGSTSGAPLIEVNAQQYYQQESSKLRHQIQMLQNTNKHLVGDSVGNLSLKELKQLESRLEKGIAKIRARKTELLSGEINYMVKREIELQNDNIDLRTKVVEGEQQLQQVTIARPPAVAPELNPFAALDMKCFFSANLFEVAVHAHAQAQVHAQAQAQAQAHAQASLQLNLGYQLAPLGASDLDHHF
uniref:Uncharacterized protein n=1 Tax=Avena sativa TaxID=4498 RepID=A0ACD5XPA3_AVESA